MKHSWKKITLFTAVATLITTTTTQAANEWLVDSKGNITLNGSLFRVKGGSWFGLEGRDESPNDEKNPRGAPMELYIGNVFWSPSGRTLDKDATEIKNLGFNCIRMPVSPQTLDDSDAQGREPFLKNDESVRINGAFTALKEVIKACDKAGLYVLLDMHSCSNYLGWRAGRLDARPPFADAKRENYAYTREECSCAATNNPSTVTRIQPYDVQKWLNDLKTLAGLGKEIGVDNIMGIDIFNEPFDYSWSEWKTLIEMAYEAISSVNPNILIFAQGIGGSNGAQDDTPDTKADTPHGDLSSNPNWGENLYEAGSNPPSMPKSKLVYSPHCYGPSVCTQPMFADLEAQPECAGLVEDAFGDAKCQIVIQPEILEKGWHEHFGYLRSMGYALCIGEFGGNMDWPAKSESRHVNRYSYLTNRNSDEQWQNAFVDYLIKMGIVNTFYWSINPESADTYGIFKTSYHPQSNTEGWGTWTGIDTKKMDLLNRLWDAPDVDPQLPIVIPANQNMSSGFNCQISNNGMITYTLQKAGSVSFKIYNVNGRLHSEFSTRHQSSGLYSMDLRQLTNAAGSYLLVVKAAGLSHSQMVSIVK
ncbi:MAG: cellulase family glycosylhydrolase [Fibrobacter sp.]|jgi:aryl-phospho-beta-D-glucosidase BglC (GH1 family)|nr:cellulase family glycosylhydrolase [Fibrobacter sp.]